MLAAQRQARIIELIRHHGAVRVADLTVELSVSDMTIRRDLDVLARRGLIDKVHGGATGRDFGTTEEPGFAAKSLRAHDEKEAIATAAAKLVEPGVAIGLSAGTTTWTLAHRLVTVPDITVVTNSMLIAGVFHSDPRSDQTIVLTGGIRTPSDALVGPLAVAALQTFNLDLVLMGVHGMDEHSGFTTPNLAEAETERAFAQAGRRLVVVADHTKWGTVGISTFAELADADILVTDEGLNGDARAKLTEHVGELVVAPVDDAESKSTELNSA